MNRFCIQRALRASHWRERTTGRAPWLTWTQPTFVHRATRQRSESTKRSSTRRFCVLDYGVCSFYVFYVVCVFKWSRFFRKWYKLCQCWYFLFWRAGVNLLVGTENGLWLLDRSGQGKVYPLISRRRFQQMDVLEGLNVLITISGICAACSNVQSYRNSDTECSTLPCIMIKLCLEVLHSSSKRPHYCNCYIFMLCSGLLRHLKETDWNFVTLKQESFASVPLCL